MNAKEYNILGGVIKQRLENTKHLDKLNWSDGDIKMALAVIEDLALFLSYELGQQYPKTFDRSKFYKSCGLETS